MRENDSPTRRLTSERGMPGAFDGETVSRRRFMAGVAQSAGAVAAASFALPALGFALAPVFDRTPVTWHEIGPLSGIPELTYKSVVFRLVPGIGDAGLALAYVRRHDEAVDGPAKDRYDHVVALSSRCVHVGCPVRFSAASDTFICPCHGGVYDFRGVRIGGPPPRPLDRFYTLVRPDGMVLIGPRFSVNNELRRFSPRDPGEPLDGIGQYLYPPRLSTAKAPPGARS